MILTSQQLAEVVNFTRSAARGKGAEQRRTARMDISYPVRMIPFNGAEAGVAFTALTRDISNEGVGMYLERPMRPGESYVVRLPRNEHDFVFVLGIVRFCGAQADGLFSIGFKFSRVIEGKMLSTVLDGQDERQRISSSVLG